MLEISLDRNREALLALLAREVDVEYFDHHFTGEIPAHPHLHLAIDTAAGICTSLLVDRYLAGAYRAWAVVGAFGDDLPAEAAAVARTLGLEGASLQSLRDLGEGMNYNAYGDTEEDLLIPPGDLYERVHAYPDPLDFVRNEPLVIRRLQVERLREASAVDQCTHDGRQACGCAVEIDVLDDAARIGTWPLSSMMR